MANILVKYLEERYKSENNDKEQPSLGPVITISREFGCPSKVISAELAEILTKRNAGIPDQPWKVITKEILDKSANEIGMEPEKIAYIFNFEKKNMLDDILEAFSYKYYKSDRKIKKTVREIIHSFGEAGNIIIIGRCGATITRDIEKSLHIRLIAPLEHRLIWIKSKFKIDNKEARKMAIDTDKNRAQLRDEFAGKKVDDLEYDLIFNTKTITTEQIVEIIIKSLETKNIIEE